MAHMNDRDAIQILCIWFCRDDMIIIRDKFCMDSRFFTGCHNLFQFEKLLDAKCDSNLIVLVGSKQIGKLSGVANHVHISVRFPDRFVIVQNTVYIIAPFRVSTKTVDIALCHTAVSN